MSSLHQTLAKRKTAPRKIVGGLSPEHAQKALEVALRTIQRETTGCQIQRVDGLTALVYFNGKLESMLHIEHLSPPTKPGVGDNWIARQAS